MKKEKKNWEKEFDKIRNDGEHCSLDDEALNKFDVIMLKDIFRELFAQEKQQYRQEILDRIEKLPKYDLSKNGISGDYYIKKEELKELIGKF